MPGRSLDANRASRRKAAPRGGPKLAREFYATALDAAERVELDRAAGVDGLDGEIAVLRVKLRQALA